MGSEEFLGNVSLDELFDALADPYRRWLLSTLLTQEEVDIMAGAAHASTAAIHHVHLPKLHAVGYVAVEDDIARRGPQFEDIAPYVASLIEQNDELPHEWP